ncbi:hypothetical protein [Olleya sp. R77988]|uniref:hypothetical protein n=1 Tax=Olleya sp. R77988 TaxID=3093875 RepID=UPI0037C94B97
MDTTYFATNLLTKTYKIEDRQFKKISPLLKTYHISNLISVLSAGLGYKYWSIEDQKNKSKLITMSLSKLVEVIANNPNVKYDHPTIKEIIALEEIPIVGELLVKMI